MAKTLSVRTRAGWTTKPTSVFSQGAEDLSNAELDANLLELEDATLAHETALATGQLSVGGLVRQSVAGSVEIEAAESAVIEFEVPAGAKILACQLRVDVALTAGETWSAAYSGGSTEAIATNQAVAKNTKVNSFVTDTTNDVTNITITKHGGGAFTAAGQISGVVYFETLTAMENA